VRRTLLVATLAGVALVLASCGGSGPPTQRFEPLVGRDFFGVNGHQLFPYATDPNPGNRAVLEKQLASIQDAGLGWVRSEADWSRVETLLPLRRRHQYDFSKYDPWVAALARHNLTWQPDLLHAPDWASNLKDRAQYSSYYRATPPDRPQDAAAFVAVLAGRYGAHGSFWSKHRDIPYRPVQNFEIWNEPNYTAFWCPTINPVAYAGLYLAARDAIHAVDPSARVVLGGLSFVPATGSKRQLAPGKPASLGVAPFLREMVAAQPALRGKVDAVGVHAYADNPQHLFTALAFYRQSLKTAGLGKVPMLFNETGWYTRGPTTFISPIPDKLRAADYRFVAETVARTNCNLIGFAPLTWRTPEKNPNNPEDWYGIANLDGSLDESGKAYRDAVRLVRGYGSEAAPRAKLPYCAR
jgi:hypothetical protein